MKPSRTRLLRHHCAVLRQRTEFGSDGSGSKSYFVNRDRIFLSTSLSTSPRSALPLSSTSASRMGRRKASSGVRCPGCRRFSGATAGFRLWLRFFLWERGPFPLQRFHFFPEFGQARRLFYSPASFFVRTSFESSGALLLKWCWPLIRFPPTGFRRRYSHHSSARRPRSLAAFQGAPLAGFQDAPLRCASAMAS